METIMIDGTIVTIATAGATDDGVNGTGTVIATNRFVI
jgi:hypothetical protein